MKFWYRLCWWIVRIGFFFWHPSFRVTGRELLPLGRAVFCANHSGMADPLWVLLALNGTKILRIMAKSELRRIPFIGWVMEKFDIIFVRRGQHDDKAYDRCVQALQNDEQMLVFIEGTRCNADKHVRARTGAIRMALETNSPIVPVFVTRNRKPFCPVRVCFGEAYLPGNISTEDHAAMQKAADEALRRIYRLGGDAYADHIGEDSGVLLRS